MWEAIARYDDGTEIVKYFPYREHDNYDLECERQHEIEEWLIGQHDGCIFYSVGYAEEEEE